VGGSLSGGNLTGAAEFNMYVDAEAAHIVFGSGIPLEAMSAPQRQFLLSFDSASSSVTSMTAFVAGWTRRAEARASMDLASLFR
jgi:inosine-uridine nucleoside N-ribohydrolase